MVDYMEVFKSLNISIETVMKYPKMLKFVPDHLKKCVSMQLESILSIKLCSCSI